MQFGELLATRNNGVFHRELCVSSVTFGRRGSRHDLRVLRRTSQSLAIRELMSRCNKAGGNSEQKQHRCGSRCYRASLGEIHGRPLPRESRWRCSRMIAASMSRVADISPVSSLRPKQSLAASCSPAGSGPTLPPMPKWAGLTARNDSARLASAFRGLAGITLATSLAERTSGRPSCKVNPARQELRNVASKYDCYFELILCAARNIRNVRQQ